MINDSANKTHDLPKELLKNNIAVDSDHKKEVLAEIEIERSWYKGVPGFESYQSMLESLDQRKITKVTETPNYAPILRFRNPKLQEKYPPFLSAKAKELLDEIGNSWRKKMNEKGLDQNIRLAITSLSRTLEYQKTLIKAGKLADPESVHTRGEAFDIDGSGYYFLDTPINPRDTKQESFSGAFNELDAKVDAPKFGDYGLYNPLVHQCLKETLIELQSKGKLHFVLEFPNSKNDVFHICRNPYSFLNE